MFEVLTEQQFKEQLLMFLAMKQTFKATELCAYYLKKQFFFKSIRNDKDEEIWVYIDGIYLPNGKSYILEYVRKNIGDLYTTYFGNQVVSKIYTDTFIEREDFFNQINKFPYFIPLQNGIFNIKTKELIEYNHNYYFFSKINANYDENKDCLKIKKFIKSITINELDYLTIQEIFGFCLLRDYKFEKGFMFYGQHGRNGKSKLLSLLRTFVGFENCASVSLQEIEKEQFCLINFYNKLVNISSDIPHTAIENTGVYKSLTGRDMINANRTGRTHIQFVNYAKMIFACNDLPIITTFSNAFWLRWVLIDFPYRFLPKHEIDSLEDKTNTFIQNPDILENLINEDELSGLFNWALEGLQRLEKKNKFSNEVNSNSVRKYWLRKSNSVSAFIEDMIIIDFESYISKADFRKHYHSYCIREKLNQLSDKAINITLTKELGLSESRINLNDDRVLIWKGIKFKTPLFNDETNTLKEYIKDKEEVTLLELNEVITDNIKLCKMLDTLESEGSIMNNRKGVWRVRK
jgi:putative DNA primase/helicase